MKPTDVSQGCWDDFLAHRKAKKAIVTQRVIDRIRHEAELANYTLEEALNECVDRGWQGFKAEWVMPKQKPVKSTKKEGLIFGTNVIDMGDANVRRLSNGK